MRKILVIMVVLIAIAVIAWFVVLPRTTLPRATQDMIQQVSDATTTGKVQSAFTLSKRLSAYEINVETRSGLVTLTGPVPSEVEKELAESVAKDTTGVKQVDNQLRVEPGLKPSEASVREGARVTDLEIRADLREQLAASQELKDKNIQAEVRDRVITLAGQVETPQQKTGAEQVARSVSNVANVINNLAATNPSAPQTETPGVSGAAARDQDLAKQVSFALFSERNNFADVGAIRAESKAGRVTLEGTVASRAERALAERIARQVSGVQSINNLLIISGKVGA